MCSASISRLGWHSLLSCRKLFVSRSQGWWLWGWWCYGQLGCGLFWREPFWLRGWPVKLESSMFVVPLACWSRKQALDWWGMVRRNKSVCTVIWEQLQALHLQTPRGDSPWASWGTQEVSWIPAFLCLAYLRNGSGTSIPTIQELISRWRGAHYM